MRVLPYLLSIFLFLSWPALADEPASPHQVIERAADDLLQIVIDGKGYFDEDPDRYYQSIDSWADSLIDYASFTRSVMGPFGTKNYQCDF